MFDSELAPIRFHIPDVAFADPHPPVLGFPAARLGDHTIEVDELWAEGLLRLERTQLYLEYQLRGELDTQPFWTEVATVKIPLASLSALELRSGWRRTELFLQARSMKLFTEIPGAENGEVLLSLPQEARDRAAALVAEAKLRAAESLPPTDL